MCSLDSVISFFAGLVVIPVVYTTTGSIGAAGPGLMFETLPLVFSGMQNGVIFGTLFFTLVFFAAITSSTALAETSMTAIDDVYKVGRKKSFLIVTLFISIAGLMCCMSTGPLNWLCFSNMHLMEMFDTISGSLLLPFLELVLCLILIFKIGLPVVVDEIKQSGKFISKKYYVLLMKFVATPYIAAMFVVGIINILDIIGLVNGIWYRRRC